MPAVDPLSATARPFVPHEFTALERAERNTMLQRLDQNAGLHRPTGSDESPKSRVYKDTLPSSSHYIPPYTHWRTTSSTSIDRLQALNLQNGPQVPAVEIGSDQWMDEEVSRCLVAAKADLDIKGKGIARLSTKIADLNKVVTLAAAKSPFSPSQPHRTSPLAPRSPRHSPMLTPNETLSPGSGPYSANSRPFARTVSAPSTSQAFQRLEGRPGDRQPSQLRVQHTLLDSPTLTETSEEGSEPAATHRSPLAGPSLPPNFGSATSPATASRSFGRSKTGVGFRQFNIEQTVREVTVNAAQNCLTTLPSALFEISNLTSLTLRSNRLTRLPAAIGELHNLRELNIGNNKISELPSTILALPRLATFHAHPNPWRVPVDEVSANGRKLGSLETHCQNDVPRLADICSNYLITPRAALEAPPFLQIPWQADTAGEAHPLLDIVALQSRIPHVDTIDLRRILQCVRSASNAMERSKKSGRRGSSASSTGPFAHDSQFPQTHRPTEPDDAAENPYYYPCPSPRHREIDEQNVTTPPTRRLFLHSAEERLEWMTVFGQPNLPVRYHGCSPGCLSFLEDAVEDEELWGLPSGDEDE